MPLRLPFTHSPFIQLLLFAVKANIVVLCIRGASQGIMWFYIIWASMVLCLGPTASQNSELPVCQQPPIKEGHRECLGSFPMWTYNQGEKRCEEYVYGGCGRSENLFKTKEECRNTCPPEEEKDVCDLPPIKSPSGNRPQPSCTGFFPKWTFNASSESCERYIYGGCGRTKNLFDTVEECQATCQSRAQSQPEVGKTPTEICRLPPVKSAGGAICTAYIPMWTFNASTEQCEKYIYGGCGRTENLFETQDICQATCSQISRPGTGQTSSPTNQKDRNICEQPPLKTEGGGDIPAISCTAYIPKWTFDSSQGNCVQYIYGGCRGSENLFDTQKQCQAACMPDGGAVEREKGCKEKVDHGRCYGSFLKWGFNTERNRCEWFLYGGCEGNENRFSTPEECLRVCGGDQPLIDRSCSRDQCQWNLWEHYEALGCKPKFTQGSCCPTHFDCPENSLGGLKNRDKCFYGGQLYAVGEVISETTRDEPCWVNCRCRESFRNRGLAVIDCVIPECPELLGGPSESRDPNCVPLYRPNSCCAYSYDCQNRTESNYACTYEGKGYVKEERFYLEADGGVRCECGDAFTGPGSPACRKPPCGFLVHYQEKLKLGCAPVYLEGGRRCPIDWVCPGAREQRESTGSTATVEVPSPSGEMSDSYGYGYHSRPSISRPSASNPSASYQFAALERCTMQPDQGRCETYQEMYFYNATAGECQKFAYGGCDGNPNRFSTGEECEAECSRSRVPHTCTLPQEIGPCKARKPAWSYDEKTGKCNLFFYGGCQGNQNNFRSMDECNRVCESYRSNKPVTSGTSSGDTAQEILARETCRLPMVVGRCKGRKIRYYYDATTGMCQQFYYSGCDGNANNFENIQECRTACIQDSSSEVFVSLCELAKEVGPCKGRLQRYYFDTETRKCMEFTYGGCKGNPNNFPTLQDCQSTCDQSRTDKTHDESDFCREAKDSGPCYGFMRRYFYDVETGKCKEFVYGGCKGNRNNFHNLHDCRSHCERTSEDKVEDGFKDLGMHSSAGMSSSSPSSRARAMGGKEEELRCELGSQVFQLGKVFKPGEKPCVTCTCSTPPDLTCVQRRCPDQPRGCRREAIRGSCCHDIICPTDQTHNSLCKECGNEEYCRITEKTGVECVKCPQLNCPIACTLAKDSNGCSICQCDG
ncbi:unnamed protein product [Darwinula stevensoni]|uniref:BPTI/Kunitz inhibitor domain-containing protein n=1 Tax=Darwinula stevensoni TaxID=69355 RepID=A0A7R8ZY68_9CRUS|nr:unnamed protein product [Darwinula stevensoni]CAG0880940.1 unnamed protein product [Darwinula stevensoni]